MDNLEQRSAEWHRWRLKGIGSSESSVLMGVNDYKDVHTLWLEKTEQLVIPNITNEDMQRGIDNEDEVLSRYCREVGIDFIPLTLQHPQFDFIRSSLDGANEATKRFCEIKCPRQHTHQKTKKHGTIKPEYYCQMQHQYLTTGFDYCDFISFDVWEQDLVIIPVPPDYDYMAELLEREIKFWECVMSRTPPDVKDFYRRDFSIGPASSVEF